MYCSNPPYYIAILILLSSFDLFYSFQICIYISKVSPQFSCFSEINLIETHTELFPIISRDNFESFFISFNIKASGSQLNI